MFLIACPSCSRQYDATGLAPGSDVRCFCDEVFCVRWPDKLTGAALTCTNCGGAVTTTDATCPYCAASISEEDRRRTTLCPGCFTRIDDDSKHCRACALEIRPQRLSPLPVDRDCPRCQGGLRTRSFDVVDVIECSACLGLWLTPEIFQKVTADAGKRNSGTELEILSRWSVSDAPKPVPVSYIPCLVCGELMQRRQYTHKGRSSGTIIDLCRGHGVWLDHEEIERILNFVATAQEAPPPPTAMDPAPFIFKGGGSLGFGSVNRSRPPHNWIVDVVETLVDLLRGRW